MQKTNFYHQGQSLIGIIIVLVIVGLITGGLYYYFQKQIPKIPEITEKPVEEEVVKPEEEVVAPPEEVAPEEKVIPPPKEITPLIPKKEIITPQWILVIVEDVLYDGLRDELNTYSDDIKRELGFETIFKTFLSTASVFEIKSYIKQIYNSYNLNGVLLIGDLPSAKMYHPELPPGSIWYSEGLPLRDFIYQDIHDTCIYSKERDAFDYTSCEVDIRYSPYWVSRLTPNSSLKDPLSLLEAYFKRNHEYRTGHYSYQRKALIYSPIILERQLGVLETDPAIISAQISSIKKDLEFFNLYKNNYTFINIEKENSDQLYLNELRSPGGYEYLLFNGHGTPTFHQKDINPDDIIAANFFWGDFRSCSVGRFTVKDYMVGKYLFKGRGLAAVGASVPIFAAATPDYRLLYSLSVGEPLYEAIKVSDIGAVNIFGDLTLRMRYDKKPSIHQINDPIITLSQTYLSFTVTADQTKTDFRIKNLGKVPLEIFLQANGIPSYVLGPTRDSPEWTYGYWVRSFLLNPGGEIKCVFGIISEFDLLPPLGSPHPERYTGKYTPGTYKGEIFILSNDPINSFLVLPFEIIVK